VLGQLGPGVNERCEVKITSKRLPIQYAKLSNPGSNHGRSDARLGVRFGVYGNPPVSQVSDPSFNTPGRIDLLVGAEWFWDLLCVGQKKLDNNLVMQRIKLGWVVGGPMAASAPQCVYSYLSKVASLERQLTRF